MRAIILLLGIIFPFGSVTANKNTDVSWIYYFGIVKDGLHNREDLLCTNYDKPAVLDVCEKVFKKLKSDGYPDLHVSYAAYANKAPTPQCQSEELAVIAATYDSTLPQQVHQSMMPCRGRHEPLRTSITVDDYYDEFYISSGPLPQTVMVYKREKEPNRQWFRPLKYCESIETTAIAKGRPLDPYSLRAEIAPQVSRNDNLLEVETIYIREMANMNVRKKQAWEYELEKSIEPILQSKRAADAKQRHRITEPKADPLNGIDKWQLLDACKRVFGCPKYRDLGFTENIAMFYFSSSTQPNVEEVAFIKLKEYNRGQLLKQSMHPCFGRNMRNANKDYSDDVLIDRYRISYGPRPSSVMVYEKTTIKGWPKSFFYSPVELVENLDLGALDSTPLSVKTVLEWLDDQHPIGALVNEKQKTALASMKRTRGRRKKRLVSVGEASTDVSKSVKIADDVSESVKTADDVSREDCTGDP